MELPPSFTATTDLGWILLMQPRQISFIITMIRTTLMDPAVEAEQPPINSRAIMMIWHVAGHRMLVSRTYPVVVAMLTTWKKDSLQCRTRGKTIYKYEAGSTDADSNSNDTQIYPQFDVFKQISRLSCDQVVIQHEVD